TWPRPSPGASRERPGTPLGVLPGRGQESGPPGILVGAPVLRPARQPANKPAMRAIRQQAAGHRANDATQPPPERGRRMTCSQTLSGIQDLGIEAVGRKDRLRATPAWSRAFRSAP